MSPALDNAAIPWTETVGILHEGVVLFDRDAVSIYKNPAALEVLGVSHDSSMVSLRKAVIYSGTSAELLVDAIRNAIANEEGWKKLVVRVDDPQNSQRWLESSAQVAQMSNHGYGLIFAFTDVTEQFSVKSRSSAEMLPMTKFAPRAQLRSATRVVDITDRPLSPIARDTRAIAAESAPDVIIASDKAGVIQWVSPSFVGLLGWNPQSLRCVDGALTIGSDDDESVQLCIAPEFVGLRETVRSQRQIRTVDGSLIWADVTCGPLLDGATLMGYQAVVRDITEHVTNRAEAAAREERMAHDLYHDQLTGLANRRALMVRAALTADGSALRGGVHAVLYCDLDNLKAVNDSLGHAAGDQLLQEVARRLRAGIRSSDFAGRYGGDEFVIVLQDVHDPDQARQIADTLVRSMQPTLYIGDVEVQPSISVGLAIAEPSVEVTYADLITLADTALYRAKQAGRDCWRQ